MIHNGVLVCISSKILELEINVGLNRSNNAIPSISFLVVFLISPETAFHHPPKVVCTNKISSQHTAFKPSLKLISARQKYAPYHIL